METSIFADPRLSGVLLAFVPYIFFFAIFLKKFTVRFFLFVLVLVGGFAAWAYIINLAPVYRVSDFVTARTFLATALSLAFIEAPIRGLVAAKNN